uniref:FAM69 protein-kinase domain-containing protein n=1 Tax=Meloidogyne enterolobii TaxID=390850 RepID=A0A6V7UP03_MELEN|nr:unnamed protein product [Meloidogyne enterolobii]
MEYKDDIKLITEKYNPKEDLRFFEHCWRKRDGHCFCDFPISCISVFLIFCPMIIFTFFIYYGISSANGIDINPNEKSDITYYNASKAQLIVDKLCNSWNQGIYAGDFCEILCAKNWTLVDYFEGGNKKVFKIHMNGADIIVKMQHPFMDQYDLQLDFNSASDEQFMDMVLDIVNDHLRLDWPRRYKKHLIRKLWPNYKDGLKLKESEKRSIWTLIQQNEYINQAVLQMSRVTPKILGVCGHSYQSEQLIPFRMKPYYLNLKAKILVHLMGTLKLFYEFLNEPLQWCDVKFENLGLSASYPKRFVMMDNDMLYTETKLTEILTSQSCLNDSDCGLFDCESRCNIESGFCSARTNDNVDVFCKKLVNQQLFGTFWSKSNKYLAACHQDPVNASQRLNELRLVWSWTLSDV